MRIFGISSLLLSTLLVASCAQTGQDRIPASGWKENAAWRHYINNTVLQTGYPIQEGCEPRRYDPPEGVSPRHKVLLVHGFTACPQQFHDWSESLAQKGVVVYLFLLPGHGFKGTEEHKYLPDGRDGIAALQALENHLIAVARGDSLPTTVGGLSVGGAVATNALLRSPASFDRGIFFTPYYEAGSTMVRLAHKTVGGLVNPLSGGHQIGWGPSCLEEERLGRSGICTFRLKHLRTVNEYGATVLRNARPLVNHIQFVGVESDPAASSGAIRKVAERMGHSIAARNHACFYKKGANHSLLSRFDSPNENKFWKAALLRDATDFVLYGRAFKESGSSSESGFKQCKDTL